MNLVNEVVQTGEGLGEALEGGQRVKYQPLNIYLGESLENASPETFGNHKILKMGIRAVKDTRNTKSKKIKTLPASFQGRVNIPKALSNVSEPTYSEGCVALAERIDDQQLQFVVLTEENIFHTERTPVFFNDNEQLNELKEWCDDAFPTSTVLIDSLITEVEYEGSEYIIEWERGKVVNGGSAMGLKVIKVNGIDYTDFEMGELQNIIGKFELQDGVNVGGGLADDLCKYTWTEVAGYGLVCQINH